MLLLMVVIGGAGSRWGAVLGGIVYHYLDDRLTAMGSSSTIQGLPSVLRTPLEQPLFLLGTAFILIVVFLPGGLTGLAEHLGESQAEEQRTLVAGAGGEQLEGNQLQPLLAAQRYRKAVGVDVDPLIAALGEQLQPLRHRLGKTGGHVTVDRSGDRAEQFLRLGDGSQLAQAALVPSIRRLSGVPAPAQPISNVRTVTALLAA